MKIDIPKRVWSFLIKWTCRPIKDNECDCRLPHINSLIHTITKENCVEIIEKMVHKCKKLDADNIDKYQSYLVTYNFKMVLDQLMRTAIKHYVFWSDCEDIGIRNPTILFETHFSNMLSIIGTNDNITQLLSGEKLTDFKDYFLKCAFKKLLNEQYLFDSEYDQIVMTKLGISTKFNIYDYDDLTGHVYVCWYDEQIIRYCKENDYKEAKYVVTKRKNNAYESMQYETD